MNEPCDRPNAKDAMIGRVAAINARLMAAMQAACDLRAFVIAHGTASQIALANELVNDVYVACDTSIEITERL